MEATKVRRPFRKDEGMFYSCTGLGMTHKTRPIFSTQFHPEAKGGPMDSAFLFDKYLADVKMYKDSAKVYKDNRPSKLMLDILSRERIGVEPTPLATAA